MSDETERENLAEERENDWTNLEHDGPLYQLLLRWFEEPLNRDSPRSAADAAMSAVFTQRKHLTETASHGEAESEALGLLREMVEIWRDGRADGDLEQWKDARALVERAGSAGAHPAGTDKENHDG